MSLVVAHCMHPDWCNPDKGEMGCICRCTSCVAIRVARGREKERARVLAKFTATPPDAGSDRRGHWMRTVGGGKFYPEDPKPEDFRIEEIAHALSMICRFGGHTPVFYSVAQHSVLVADAIWDTRTPAPPLMDAIFDDVLFGLLHDAAEAYLGDVVWPLKRAPEMNGYRQLEARVEKAIRERFGLQAEQPAIVKHFDLVLLATEKRDLLGSGQGDRHELDAAKREGSLRGWHGDEVQPLKGTIQPWGPEEAKRVFLHRYAWVTEMRGGQA